MKFNSYLFFLFFIAVLFNSHVLANNKLNKAPVPTWVRANKLSPSKIDIKDIGQGYYYDLIEYQVNIGEQIKFFRDVKVLFDSNGAENAGQISINFDPKYQQVTLHELKVIRDGKTIDKLDVGKFTLVATETDLSRFIYNGTYSAYYILDDLRKDDKIIVSYSLKGFNPVFENKFFDKYYLQSYEPIGLAVVNYIVPKNRKLNFKSHNNASKPLIEEGSNHVSYSWEEQSFPAVEFDEYAPAWYTNLQWIECTEFNSWSEVGGWMARTNPTVDFKDGSPLALLVDRYWVDSQGDSMKFLKKVTHFVQNDIRYMGVELGEFSHRANTPEKIFNQRYGDCKDKSLLMISMLKRKGIKGSLVLANSYLTYGMEDYLPSPGAFNHVVAAIEIGDRQQYIDPTITNQGGGITDLYFPYYGRVLKIDDSKHLTSVDKNVNGLTKISETYLLDSKGGAILEVKTSYSASSADFIRTSFKESAKNQIQKSYLDYYKKMYPKISIKESLKFEDEFDKNIIHVTERYYIEKIGEKDEASNKNIFGIYASQINNNLPELNSSEGLAPLGLYFPYCLEYDIRIVNHGGVEFNPERESSFIDRDSYYFGKTVKTSKDTLIISYNFGFHNPFVASSDKKQYVDDFKNRDVLLYNAYYIEDNGIIVGSNISGKISMLTIFGCVCIILICVIFILRYNKTASSSMIQLYEEPEYHSVGGWLILLIISMVITTLRVAYNFFESGYLTQEIWESYRYTSYFPDYVHKIFVASEILLNIILLMGFIYCIYLFSKKRDLFPQTMIVVLAVMFLSNVVFTFFNYFYMSNILAPDVISTNVKNIIYSVLWGMYLYNSERVKGTFVNAYNQELAIDKDTALSE